MIELQVDAEVTESRQVTITLPSEVPLGQVRLTVGVCPPGTASHATLRALDAEPDPDGYFRSGQVVVVDPPERPR